MSVCTGVGFFGGGAVTCRETSATDDEMQRARRVGLKETRLGGVCVGVCVFGVPEKKHLLTTNPFYPFFHITYLFICIVEVYAYRKETETKEETCLTREGEDLCTLLI